MQRISIIGTTGSGKSALAKKIAHKLSIPCIELDAINWQKPDWNPLTQDELQEQVVEAICGERWVIEGGYSAVRPLIWERADTVIWLNYSLPVTFVRLLRRTARRVTRHETLWGSNHETLTRTLSRDSILLWCLKTHSRRRRQFPELLARPENQHLRVLCFRTPQQTEAWLKELTQGTILV